MSMNINENENFEKLNNLMTDDTVFFNQNYQQI